MNLLAILNKILLPAIIGIVGTCLLSCKGPSKREIFTVEPPPVYTPTGKINVKLNCDSPNLSLSISNKSIYTLNLCGREMNGGGGVFHIVPLLGGHPSGILSGVVLNCASNLLPPADLITFIYGQQHTRVPMANMTLAPNATLEIDVTVPSPFALPPPGTTTQFQNTTQSVNNIGEVINLEWYYDVSSCNLVPE